MRGRSIASALAVLIWASPAYAEVSDKAPTVSGMWTATIALNILAWALGRKLPVLALIPLPFSALFAYGAWEELNDPFFSPTLKQELGQAYFEHSYVTASLAVAGPVIAYLVSAFHRRRTAVNP